MWREKTGTQTLIGRDGSEPGQPLVDLTSSPRVFDPWLTVTDASLVLFFAAEQNDGVTYLYRANGMAGFVPEFAPPVEVVDPGTLGLAAIASPTVWSEGAGSSDERWTMIARATYPDGERTFIWLDGGSEGTAWTLGGTVFGARPSEVDAFDRDDLAEPALVRTTNPRGETVFALYYAGRRGSRWRIGLAVSEDLVGWRRVGPVLSGADVGFDAIGVRSPAPRPSAGGFDLFYLGTDGREHAYGLATRIEG